MVAHLLRLKLALLRNGLRRSAWQLVGLAVAALYALGATLGILAGLVALSSLEVATIRTVLVLLGAAVVLGWWFLPLVAFGVDATLDPARFVTFAIPRRTLLTGLALGSLLGIPGATTAVVVLASALTWWRDPVAAVVAVPCALVALGTCAVGARATTTALAPLFGRRRYREVVAIVALIPMLLLGPTLSTAMIGISAGRDALPALADVAGWTPLGAAWAVPADVAAGAYGRAALEALVAVATLAALVAIWDRALSRALVTPASAGREGPTARSRGLGALGWLPPTPTGAVMARCLTYWVRDPRYAKALVVVPLIPVLLYFSVGANGGGLGVLLIAGPLIALVLGWTISSDVALDGTAFWTHVAAPISGRVDRVGRVLAAGLVCGPVTLALVVGTVALTGRWETLLALTGMSVGLLLTSLGVASVVSARVVYQVPRAGESPFASQQGGSMAAFVSQLAGWGVVLVVSLPEMVLGGFAVGTGSVLLGVLTLVVGVVLGGVLLLVGIRIGSRILDRNAPELLARMVSFG